MYVVTNASRAHSQRTQRRAHVIERGDEVDALRSRQHAPHTLHVERAEWDSCQKTNEQGLVVQRTYVCRVCVTPLFFLYLILYWYTASFIEAQQSAVKSTQPRVSLGY